MTENEEKLVKALEDLIDWYKQDLVMVSVGVQRFATAERVVKEVKSGQD